MNIYMYVFIISLCQCQIWTHEHTEKGKSQQAGGYDAMNADRNDGQNRSILL